MKILGLGNRMSGVTLHRITLPLAYMEGIKATVTDLPSIEILEEGWDIIYFNRLSPLDKDWQDVKTQMKCKIIMDIGSLLKDISKAMTSFNSLMRFILKKER